MPVAVKVPSASEMMLPVRVTISRWHAAAGDLVKCGDLLVTLDSDEVVCDLEAHDAGSLEILAPEGRIVSTCETIALIHAA